MRPRLVTALAVALLVPTGASSATDRTAARAGASWLAAQSIATTGQQADAVITLAANGASARVLRGRFRQMASAAPAYATSAGATGKVVLAAVAAGYNPRRINGVNYIARIRATYAAGRFGANTYDQAYAMLALRASGERVPPAAVTSVLRARGSGGWGYDLRRDATDDISATSLTIEALRAASVPSRHTALRRAATWLLAQRNSAGGFGIDGGGRPTEANATAMAIQALRALGRRPPATALRELRALQDADGSFRFTATNPESRLLATLDASLALAGAHLPVRP